MDPSPAPHDAPADPPPLGAAPARSPSPGDAPAGPRRPVGTCIVPGCGADLGHEKPYYRRFGVCQVSEWESVGERKERERGARARGERK